MAGLFEEKKICQIVLKLVFDGIKICKVFDKKRLQ